MMFNLKSSSAWAELLRKQGYRYTGSLQAVISVLWTSHRALSPSEIHIAAHSLYPSLGLATVYRILDRLEQLEMIHRVHQSKDCSLFLRATVDHEHLLLCTSCHNVEYIHEDDLTSLEADISRRSGFTIQGHLLQFHGLCSACQKSDSKRKESR